MNVYAFNEHTLDRTNWRSSIDNSMITCLNKEISDNSFKVSRWLVQALLAEADLVKFAFISRKDMNDNTKHVVVATHTVQTISWASQMNISMDRMWCILKYLVNEIHERVEEAKKDSKPTAADEEEGDEHEFILLKDFNTMSIRLYRKDEEGSDEEEQIQT